MTLPARQASRLGHRLIPGISRRDLALFWASCLMLFFEICIIRWLSAEVRIFSYIHNLVLLFAFLGIGLGTALARKEPNQVISFAVMAALAALLGLERLLGLSVVSAISVALSVGT